MNINPSNVESPKSAQNNSIKSTSQKEDIKFSDELKGLEKKDKDVKEVASKEEVQTKKTETDNVKNTKDTKEEVQKKNAEADNVQNDKDTKEAVQKKEESFNGSDGVQMPQNGKTQHSAENVINSAFDDLSDIFKQLNVEEINQKDEKNGVGIKNIHESDDNKNEEQNLINNEYNIQDKERITQQMNLNMSFSGDGQPFSSFMGEESNGSNAKNNVIGVSQQELDEEAKILSTMSENIEIANRNMKATTQKEVVETTSELDEVLQKNNSDEQEKTVNRNDGIKTVDVKSGVVIETVVKYDNIIMNEADVEVFTNLVQNNEVNLNNLTTEEASKTTQISKTLADMLAKAKETSQPLRIDFDNDISVIIRISRDGKLSADFLPSSQVAEAYLKENLPLLKQRFDENNINYEELNQRNSRERDRENNKRKERNNE